MEATSNENERGYIARAIRRRERTANPYSAQTEHSRLRQLYRWLPTDVEISAEGKVRCTYNPLFSQKLDNSGFVLTAICELGSIFVRHSPNGSTQFKKCSSLRTFGTSF